MASVPVEVFLTLVAGQLHLLCIHDDDIVTHIHVRRERGLVLATQARGDDRRETAKNDAFGVDHDPFLVDICRCCRKCFHFMFRFQVIRRENRRGLSAHAGPPCRSGDDVAMLKHEGVNFRLARYTGPKPRVKVD